MAEYRPDCVIHTAAMTQVDDCEKDPNACRLNNVDAVRFVAEACEPWGTHLVHLSTDFVFDGQSGPYLEEDVPNPLSIYGQSKADAEQIIRQYAGPWSIVRTVLVYGLAADMSRSNIVLWVKKSLEEGRVIRIVSDQFRTPTLAEDLAEGCCQVALRKATGIYNISGGVHVGAGNGEAYCQVLSIKRKFNRTDHHNSLGTASAPTTFERLPYRQSKARFGLFTPYLGRRYRHDFGTIWSSIQAS